MKIKSSLFTEKGILMASIVVPAISETINLSSLINLLINVDFPALGLPKTAIFRHVWKLVILIFLIG